MVTRLLQVVGCTFVALRQPVFIRLFIFYFLFYFIFCVDTRLPGNLLDNPNFAPVDGWEEQGYTYNIVTQPWHLIQPTNKQYRLEPSTVLGEPGTFCVLASNNTFNTTNNPPPLPPRKTNHQHTCHLRVMYVSRGFKEFSCLAMSMALN